MIGIVIATHGEFGKELLSTLQMILGETEGAQAVSLQPADSPEHYKEKIEAALKKVDPKGKGSLLLVDMMGGTPFNVGVLIAQNHKLQIVTGVNLPMLIKAATTREGADLEKFALETQKVTQESILTTVEMFKKQS
jgi:PTS system mannose-specific IIA component